jgi:hypothetical protein
MRTRLVRRGEGATSTHTRCVGKTAEHTFLSIYWRVESLSLSLSPSLMKARLKSLSVAHKKNLQLALNSLQLSAAAAKAARTALDVFDLAAAAYFTACPLHHKSPSAATTCICMTVPPL